MAAVAIEYGPIANSGYFTGEKTEDSEKTETVIELCLVLQKLHADLHDHEL